jgi:hypothetical protein
MLTMGRLVLSPGRQHAIANGRITDADNDETKSGKHIAADAVGKTYLWLSQQDPTLWTHELDLRPAQEKF